MESSIPVPMLICVLRISQDADCADSDGLTSLKSTFSIRKTQASAISSLQRNSRIGAPLPQISTETDRDWATGRLGDWVTRMPYLSNIFNISSSPFLPFSSSPFLPFAPSPPTPSIGLLFCL